MVNPKDIAGNEEKKKNGELQRFSWGTRRRRRRMVNPIDIAAERDEEGDDEEEEW